MILTAVLAALLASAVALCFSGSDDSSAEPLCIPEAAENEESPVPATSEPPAEHDGISCPPEFRNGTPPAFPPGKQPEGPPPSDSEPAPRPAHGDKPPMIVIDASGRPHSPEEILEEYSIIYKEKVALEVEGNEVVVYDETLVEEAGEELAGVLFTIFGGAITDSAPESGSVVTPSGTSGSADAEFLIQVLANTAKGSWLESLVQEMLDKQLRNSPAYRGMVPPDTRQTEVPDPPPERLGNGTNSNDSEEYVDDVSYPIPSSESYLVEHGFDGGAPF